MNFFHGFFLIISLMMKKQTIIVVNNTKYATNPGVISNFLKNNQNTKFELEVVSLRDSKVAEPIVVEINILKIDS